MAELGFQPRSLLQVHALSPSPHSQTLAASVKQACGFVSVHVAPDSLSTYDTIPVPLCCLVTVPSSTSSHLFRIGSDISSAGKFSPAPFPKGLAAPTLPALALLVILGHQCAGLQVYIPHQTGSPWGPFIAGNCIPKV